LLPSSSVWINIVINSDFTFHSSISFGPKTTFNISKYISPETSVPSGQCRAIYLATLPQLAPVFPPTQIRYLLASKLCTLLQGHSKAPLIYWERKPFTPLLYFTHLKQNSFGPLLYKENKDISYPHLQYPTRTTRHSKTTFLSRKQAYLASLEMFAQCAEISLFSYSQTWQESLIFARSFLSGRRPSETRYSP
jgi:hypothetical protein